MARTKQLTMFEVPASGASLAVRLAAFKKEHGILTHYNKACRPVQWMALLPYEEDKGKDIATICAESARLYEEDRHCVTGKGELSCVRELCELNGIKCPL